MKKGQTSIRGGVQDFLCPFTELNITQGANGSYSHKGLYDIDTAGKDINAYAPCDCVCKAVDKQYAFVWWESKEKVRWANGDIDYVTFYFGHDSNITAVPNMTINQGVLIAQQGTGGVADGRHTHFGVAKGKFVRTWTTIGNNFGLANQVNIEDVCFMDGTTITVGKANWKYLKDVPVNTTPTPPTSPSKVDNVLHANEKFVFNKVYKNEGLKYINGVWAVYNGELGAYIGVGLITKCDANGNVTANQTMATSGDYFKIQGTFTVGSSGNGTFPDGWVIPKGWGFKINAKTLQEVA